MPLSMLNRHGLVAGATGTGKTKTLQLMAEQMTAAGHPGVPRRHQGRRVGRRGARRRQRAHARARAGDRHRLDADRLPGGVPRARRPRRGRPRPRDDDQLRAGAAEQGAGARTTRRRAASGWSSTSPTRPGLPLLDLKDLRAVINHLTSDEGKDDLKELGGLSAATAGVILRELIGLEDAGRRRLLRRARVRHRRPAARRRRRSRRHVGDGPDRRAGQAEAVQHVPHVDARRPVPRPARGRRRRAAQAGVLLRRGAPAVRRRERGVPGRDRPDGAADPLQGRRRVLRDADAEGRAERGARAARQPGAARPARVHARRRQGAQGDRVDVPEERRLRPRRRC